MKRIATVLICVFCIAFLLSCDFNAPLRKKMLNYYAQDDNYTQLSGMIKMVSYREKNDELYVEIDLLNNSVNFPYNIETGYAEFVLVHYSEQEIALAVNDSITFTSAPMYFYNGHILPIVHIEKDGDETLSFKKGKESYLAWISKTFD